MMPTALVVLHCMHVNDHEEYTMYMPVINNGDIHVHVLQIR